MTNKDILLQAALASFLCSAAASAEAPDALTRARETAARGSEAKALAIAAEGLKASPSDRALFLYTVELLPEAPSKHAAAVAAAAHGMLDKASEDYAWPLGLCKALRVSGRAQEALSNCRKAMQLDPTAYPPYRELGLTYAAAGNSRKAAETIEQGVEIASSSYQAHYQLARVRENNGDLSRARRSYEAALSLTRRSRDLDAEYYGALIKAGLRRVESKTAAAKDKPREPEPPGKKQLYASCVAKFREEAGKDNLLNAIDISAGCIKISRSDPELAAERAPLLVRSGKYEEGIKEYGRAASLYGPKNKKTAFLRIKAAETCAKLGDAKGAMAQYRLAAEADPSDLNALKGLADSLEARSLFKEAMDTYEKILKLEPANEKAKTRLEELRMGFLPNDRILEELRLRNAIDAQKTVLQPEDIKLFKAIRAAEINDGVDYVREKMLPAKGLIIEKREAASIRFYLSGAGYKAYLFHATRDAIRFFEKQKIGMREIFKLRDTAGADIFDKAGQITPEGLQAWQKGKAGTKTWLMPYESVPESPAAVKANKDLAEAQGMGYRELSEPEYIWLLKATNCPEDVMQADPLKMKVINDGARVRFLLCSVENSACMNPINLKLVSYIASYRDGDDKLSQTNTSTAFFGTGAVKKYRFCENGRLWDGK
ncbi:MAG TPA: hypothetical protein DCZ92_12510 [Elusimicrobia bacterium]|nr:MAG: hypothetical protein A2016_02450 [Elusimicrobia bacterium GWF2_62_30]HBA61611.1 hypothetical protein [Elusimicrobiota bacterium]